MKKKKPDGGFCSSGLPKTKNLRKAAALFGDKRFILIKQFR